MPYFQQENPVALFGQAGRGVGDALIAAMMQAPQIRSEQEMKRQQLELQREHTSAIVQNLLAEREQHRANTELAKSKRDTEMFGVDAATRAGNAAGQTIYGPSTPGYNSPTIDSANKMTLAAVVNALTRAAALSPTGAAGLLQPHNINEGDVAVDSLGRTVGQGREKPVIVPEGSLAYRGKSILPGAQNLRPGASLFVPPGTPPMEVGAKGSPVIPGSSGQGSSLSALLSAFATADEKGMFDQYPELKGPSVQALVQALQAQTGGGSASIPPGAIAALKANPSLAAKFDEKYGQGQAAKVLGN